MSPRILVVEDEPDIAAIVVDYLRHAGYTEEHQAEGRAALASLITTPPDLTLLDIMLPGMDGLEILRQARRHTQHPIIMLTARVEEVDRLIGLELGADDYICKPFSPREVVARVKAVLRRGQPEQQDNDMLSFPGLTISLSRYEVLYQGKQAEMPPKEIELFYFLASHPNTVFTREQLLEKVWGFDYFGDSRTVDVHVKRLREKLTDCEELGWSIKTVWSVGYKFEVK